MYVHPRQPDGLRIVLPAGGIDRSDTVRLERTVREHLARRGPVPVVVDVSQVETGDGARVLDALSGVTLDAGADLQVTGAPEPAGDGAAAAR